MKITKSKLREIIGGEIQKLNEAEVWFNPKKADPLFKKLGLDFPKYPKEGDVLYKGKKVGYMSNFKGLMVYSKSLLKKLQDHSSKYKLGIWNPNQGLTMESLRNTIRKMIREADESDKYSHIGYGKYREKGKEDDKDAQTFQKTDSGKFEPVGDEKGGEKEKPKPKVTKIAADPFGDKDSETGKDYTSKVTGGEEDDWEPEAGLGYDDPDYAGPKDKTGGMDDDDWEPEAGLGYDDPGYGGEEEDEDDLGATGLLKPKDKEKHADTIMAIAKDDVEFDGYDANDRPLFVSIDDPDLEYTVDKKGNIWRHDGFKDKVIGTTSAGTDESVIPQLQKEFKQYKFLRHSNNWRK